ncbi:uncharacterized protein LOC132745239 isoform X2 [Ruditapes philippinarum]|uniref:uncharacterized protein LOC132745239 isoform X2 n=1 Tax=Ruditapes philippinarum TaxID=129788 RepID=UPI00295B6368|nr:uncharacterized protein LOC132745239 isoform X2 [Ruditapes philippinarum]
MSGISLPPVRGAIPKSYSVPNGFDSRPGSANSGRTSSMSTTALPQMYYDNCVFQTPRNITTSRSYTKLPSLRGPSRASHASAEIHSKYSAKYRSTPDLRTRLSANSPFLPKASSEECLKCLLKIPHKKCESHKYIRVGGGYRHGYWYVKCLLEELELQRQRELIAKQRLEAIKEKSVRAIKTYIRTKSGRLVERIIFMTEEDYEAFKSGKGAADILKKYLTKDEAEGLESWDKDEVKAIKTYVRTKSGRLIEKVVYVSKEDYDAITQGKVDAKDLLKKYVKEGETVEGWDEAKMKTIKTYVRTKSGRLIEKTIMISQEDYDKMIKEGLDPNDIIKKYLPLEEGQTIEGWESEEPMKAIKMMVRTKSGRLIEKTIMVRADEYDRLMAGGGDMNEILGKYLGEDGGTVEGWEKAEGKPMKVIKTLVRTKSGRLIEKTVLLTEEEYRAFQEAGGDPEFLKRFMKLEKGEVIEDWEKASTVFDDDDPELATATAGQRIVGKDGAVYEVVVDPLTGKKYKKKIGGPESDFDSGIASMQKGKKGKKGGKGGIDEEETAEQRMRRKAGKRDPDSDSDYSYKSFVSAGGTRHVQRRRKRADGTYSDPESYHSDKDPEGAARRRRRRREREHQNSAHSYYSVVSEGGTRHVRRRRKRADGTYSDSESYHSADSDKPGGRLAEKKRKEKEAKEGKTKIGKDGKIRKKRGGSGSDYSYTSEVSEGGTRRVTRRKKIKDEHGNVIGYGKAESFEESDDESVYTEVSDGKGGKMLVKKPKMTSKQKQEAKIKAKAAAKAKEQIGKIKGGKFADVGDFSDSTISEDVDLENMTEEEKAAYFKAKAERKAAREAKRREKYGDKYDLMMEKQKELKKLKKLQEMREKGLISPSSDWSIDSDTGEPVRKSVKKEAKKQKILQDLREKGLISPSSDWTVDSEGNPVRISELVAQGKRKKKKDGNDADDESDESEYDPITGEKIKKKDKKKTTRPGDEGPDGYEYTYDEQGRVIGKKRLGWGDDSGSEYEYEYDKDGNVRVVKKEKEPKKFGGDDEDAQFEVGADGKIRLRDGKKKIDLSKLTDDDLRKLGIDPTLDKKEIARLLKEKFGADISITDNDRIIPTKRASEYGSDANTDDLADDEDLDITTLRGIKKVNVVWKRGGKKLQDHMKKILEQSKLKEDDYAKDLDEKDADIDFLTHYKLVDPGLIETYARAFVVEDGDFDTVISCKETKTALEGVPSVQQMTPKQFEYVFKVLKIDDASQVTFRMFAVISALCERVTKMDPLSKYLLEVSDLLDIQRKMDLYRAMFYCNAESDRDANFIKCESLKIELIAGGLNWKQQNFIMDRLQPNAFLEISFLDYLCYVPLFLSMHENIVTNPLDMADDKYDHMMRKPSGGHRQRDMNPLGNHLKRDSVFQLRSQAQDLLDGKIKPEDLKDEKRKLLEKVATLPKLIEEKPIEIKSDSPPPMIWS